MTEEKVIKLEDIVELVDNFLKGEVTAEEMADYGAKMSVRAYLPLLDKMKIVIALSTRYIYSSTELHEVRVAELYRDLFFYGLLAPYGNVNCDNISLITFANYDKLFPIFSPFLLSYCESDYKILKEYLHDTLDSYSTRDFIDVVNGISADALSEATKENKRMLRELENNKDVIRDLKEIAAMNNPITQKVVEELRNIAVEKSNQPEKKEDK